MVTASSRNRVLALAAIVALLAGVQPVARAVAGDPAAPVEGLQQAYTAGRLVDGEVVDSVPVAYEGDPLTVQAVPIGRDAFEPTLGVDRDGVAYMAAGAFDGPRGLPRTKVLKSVDGGVTWAESGPRAPAGDTTIPPATLDPYVYVDEETGRVFNLELNLACSTLSFSDDQGATWLTNPLGCGQFVNDHQTIVAGNARAGLVTAGYPNVLYYCFNRVTDASCSRSLDGGVVWAPTGSPSFPGYEVGDPYDKFGIPGLCGGLHGHAVTDGDGRLFIPKSHCGLPTLAVSEDGGTTWRRTVVTTALPTGEAHVGEHHSVTVDDAGNVYYLFWDDGRQKLWLAVSTDHGATFGEPRMVAPPGVAQANLPALTAGAAGHIAFQFPGTTVDDPDDEQRPWNSYMVVSTNATDAEPLFMSTTANDPDDPIHRGDCNGRCAGMFDFLDIVVSPVDGGFWAAVTDTCTATRDCNVSRVVDADERLAVDAEGIAVRQLGGPRLRPATPAG
jgi:hypothetical protein